MALVTIQNLTASILSTDVGSLQPSESKSLQMGPEQAYRASEGLKALVDSGRVLVTITDEAAKLDSLEPASVGTASVADGAVSTIKLAAGAVTSAKLGAGAVDATALGAGAVTTAKFAAGAVDSAALGALSVVAGKIATGGVSASAQFAAGVVDAPALAASAVQATKIAFFKSSEQTGTGSSQNIAHGLSTTPGLVMVLPSKVNAAGDTFVEGAHDATNAKVTAASGAKYFVIAVK